MKKIDSPSNPEIKDLVYLKNKSKARRERGVFVVEGRREFARALRSGYRSVKKFRNPELLSQDDPWIREYERAEGESFDLSGKAYEKVAMRETTEGVLGVFEARQLSLEELSLDEDLMIVVLDGVQKPGNIGAIFRTADAVGAHAVVLVNYPGDIYNPHTVRASLGCLFSMPFVVCEGEELKGFLKKNSIEVFSAIPDEKSSYYDCDFTGSSALVFGAEDSGVGSVFDSKDVSGFSIPMNGMADSLNVSVSVAVVLYEALRQRTAKAKSGI